MQELAQTVSLYTMETAAERPPNDEENVVDEQPLDEEDPSGLHAKLYMLESGWDIHVLTGSANATSAAFKGRNVEFLTELVGKKSVFGINQLLGEEKDSSVMTLMDLLIAYKIPDTPLSSERDIKKELEKKLDNARRSLSRAGLLMKISDAESGDGKYCITLLAPTKPDLPSGLTVTCWPVMLPESYGKDIAPAFTQGLVFSDITLLALTRFIVFKVIAKEGDNETGITFVMNLPAVGMPEERNDQILKHIIGSSERFIRYLLLLLSENPEGVLIDQVIRNSVAKDGENGEGEIDIPLFEELVRAYSRQPEKLQRVDALVRDLKKSTEGAAVLPEGFDEVWTVFKEIMPLPEKG